MKKAYLFIVIAAIFTSCQQSNGPQSMKVINLAAKSSDWIETIDSNGLNRYYSCHFSMPEITSFVYNNGTVVSYYEFTSAQLVLPYVQHNQDTSGHLWTRTIDYDYSVGGINVRVTNSDFAVDPPGAMSFRVVLMW